MASKNSHSLRNYLTKMIVSKQKGNAQKYLFFSKRVHKGIRLVVRK